MNIKICGIDPSLRNFGYARAVYDLTQKKLEFTGIALVTTEKDSHKTVRRNSDDLWRSQQQIKGLNDNCRLMNIAVAEVPVGSQSARAMASYGMCVGILAACPVPLIQVSPDQVKLAAVGHKQAAKEEMIEWAMTTYPHLPWPLQQKNGAKFKKGDPLASNEHLADAVASVCAGILTDEFKQLVVMSEAMVKVAA